MACRVCEEAVQIHGGYGYCLEYPVQRFWRDAHAGRVHAANDAERAYVMFGNQEFGLPLGDTMV